MKEIPGKGGEASSSFVARQGEIAKVSTEVVNASVPRVLKEEPLWSPTPVTARMHRAAVEGIL